MTVVVVESPAKAKTINKYLGGDYQVLASFGHVRDLPAKDGSVDPDKAFEMVWEVDGKSEKRLQDIAKAVRGADRLVLATDPDREGEAISWHVLEVLKQKRALKDVKVQRVVFNAITKQAVTEAMAQPRDIDSALVEAYLARRALDYLVGFTLSPVLWRKLPGAKSAGRVQSVALRLVCQREAEIEAFVAREYWSLVARLATPKGDAFEARLVGVDGKKLGKLDVATAVEAKDLEGLLRAAKYRAASVEAKPVKRHPAPPFTTSTLQQEASRKLGLSPARTMQIAQRLYEGVDVGGETVGLITYMRTDGVQIAGEALAATRRLIDKEFGAGYLPEVPRAYRAKAKNAQEAHEAIRPTDLFRKPKDVARHIDREQADLYELIWTRTVASQMESAVLERTTVEIVAGSGPRTADLRAVGTVVTFDGFLKLYREGEDDPESDEDKRLPAIAERDDLVLLGANGTQHFTEPPPRYSEASLVKRMEELGIGRPSTYAATLAVLRDREYVTIDKKRLHAEDKGRLVTTFLERFFDRYVEYGFTAALEEQLDQVSAGELDWKALLAKFWKDFSAHVADTKDLKIGEVIAAIDEALAPHVFPTPAGGGDPRKCPSCADGKLSLKLGKFGAFVGCSNYPGCKFTRPFGAPNPDAAPGEEGADGGNRKLGPDPETGEMVTLRDGRFGPYVQLGEGEKPKRATLPKGVTPANIDLTTALKLLSLPRTVGKHPETGQPILANIGRYGPYIQHEKTYVNLPSAQDVFEVGINRAVDLIAEKLAGGPRARFGRAAQPAAQVGDHPTLGGAIELRDGKYGAYVSHQGVNATLPKTLDKAVLTLDVAVKLIDEKRASGPAKAPPRGAAKPKAAKPAASAAKKPAKGKGK
jgi:DNA topoisomerase I